MQLWNVTKYIYLSNVLEYSFEVLALYLKGNSTSFPQAIKVCFQVLGSKTAPVENLQKKLHLINDLHWCHLVDKLNCG